MHPEETTPPKFRLWFEFEVTTPWPDLENDFANIEVGLLDGKSYGINVWTFKYLATVLEEIEERRQNCNGVYLQPPDLLVKELTRTCIERSIADLLQKEPLEQVLNPSVLI
jgi:hypothetical protein